MHPQLDWLLAVCAVAGGFVAFALVARFFGEESALVGAFLVLFALIARAVRRMDSGVAGWDPLATMTVAGFGLLWGALVIAAYAAIYRRLLDPD